MEWLKHNTSPYLQVENRWRQTCKKRQTILKSTPINEYMKMFPILQKNEGFNMVRFFRGFLYGGVFLAIFLIVYLILKNLLGFYVHLYSFRVTQVRYFVVQY